MEWCYEHDVAIVPRGGGTAGFAGGAVPVDGGVVLSLERMTAVRARAAVADVRRGGVRTSEVRRRARENGPSSRLTRVPPSSPRSAATSRPTRAVRTRSSTASPARVTGIEAVVPPGDVINLGGAIRKDVAGYDVKSLLIGSRGRSA